jgi:tetratricopeptide (TPR) repeat protein
MPFFLKYLYLFLLLFNFTFSQEVQLNQRPIDSILSLIDLSNDSDHEYELRKKYAHDAVEFSKSIRNDSLSLKSTVNLAFIYLEIDDLQPFKKYSNEGLELATKLNDSFSVAKAHENLGWYYSQKYNPDSSYFNYFQALKLYELFNNTRKQSSVLLNMVLIQEAAKDYVGGETNAVRAINLVKTLPETEENLDLQWALYNMLGVISERLKEYQRAIDYHNIALGISEKM